MCEASGSSSSGHAGRDPPDGREGAGARLHAGARRAGAAGSQGVLKSAGRGARAGRTDRLPGDPEGVGRRRRARHAHGAAAEELPALLAQAQAEAGAAFSSADVYLEKFVGAPRHIEFQVLADEHGNVGDAGRARMQHPAAAPEADGGIALAGGDAGVRKRIIGDGLREALRATGYTNAGTVEFLMDETGKLYFIEVNARMQVEHPVTELVTGIDIVKARFASPRARSWTTSSAGRWCCAGHAIECRINAENPETFVPSPGRITGFNLPGGIGVRVDTWAYTDCVIPPYYDSLVAKLIAYGSDRDGSDRRMSGRWRCSSSKGSTRRFRCTNGSSCMRISSQGIWIQAFWRGPS